MLIGLCGFIGSGKDTVADILVEYYGFKRESFAKPLKDAVSIIFGWDRKKLEGATPEDRTWRDIPDPYWSKVLNKIFTPRLALQLMGTEAGRNVYGESLWTSSCLKRIQDDSTSNYVITDVRFRNELKALNEVGASIVEIKRGDNPEYYIDAVKYNIGIEELELPKPNSLKSIHQSEWDWIGSPYICKLIDNCGTIEQLKEKVLDLMEGKVL